MLSGRERGRQLLRHKRVKTSNRDGDFAINVGHLESALAMQLVDEQGFVMMPDVD